MNSLVTVSGASDSFWLTTLEQAKLSLDLGPADVADEALIRHEIGRQSAAIVQWLRRDLARQSYSEVFRDVCSDLLILANAPIVTIDSVTVDGAVLASTDYEYDAGAGLLYHLCNDYRAGWYACKVTVAYTAGFVLPKQTKIGADDLDDARNLPFDIESAAIELVKYRYFSRERDPSTKSIDIPGVLSESFGDIGPDGIPEQVKAILAPYRNTVTA